MPRRAAGIVPAVGASCTPPAGLLPAVFSPRRWTAEQIADARCFVESFISPDGIPQADPIRRKGKWRL